MSDLLPNCREHKTLVRDLALGLLDGDRAVEAEAVRTQCPACRAWWQGTFSGRAFENVMEQVGSTLSTTALPPRRHGRHWQIAAVAAVIALTVGVVSMMPEAPEAPAVAQQDQPAITVLDFEDPAVVAAGPDVVAEQAGNSEPLFADGMEDGGLGGWVVNS